MTWKMLKGTMVIGCVFIALAMVLLATTLNHSWQTSERPIHLVQKASSTSDILKSVKYYLKSAISDRLEDVQEPILPTKKIQNLNQNYADIPSNLVKSCAFGNDDACREIESKPADLRSLVAAVSRGGASMRRASPLVDATSTNRHRRRSVEGGAAGSRGPSGQHATAAQGLSGCMGGDWAACETIAGSAADLDRLLSSPPAPLIMASPSQQRVLQPVFVPPAPSGGVIGRVMAALGLSDEAVPSGVRRAVAPRMVPDEGLAPGKAAEWNDGTVAPGLSDRPGSRGARALPSLFLPSRKAVAATQAVLHEAFPDAHAAAPPPPDPFKYALQYH
mmetsp:Transcript_40325/g.84277  ORF Transcript_40325/g.84277 Transcript_40325/m.84277 type:complete len:333 (-) Transcript_40325:414-1412(-)